MHGERSCSSVRELVQMKLSSAFFALFVSSTDENALL